MAEGIDVAALMRSMNGGGRKEEPDKYKNYDPDGKRGGRGNGGGNRSNGNLGNGGNRPDGNGRNGENVGNHPNGNGRNLGNGGNRPNGNSRNGGNSGGNGSGNRSNGNGGYGGGGRSMPADMYVGAPYNFVSFSDKVYEYPQGKLTAHSDMKDELATGEISYEITTVTPVFVDDGKGEFNRNSRGEYAIPGSTMRGLIRNNVQILGLSSFGDDIDDYALMYRNVAAGLQKDRYNKVLGADTVTLETGAKNKQVSVLKNVQAGYIRNVNGKYYIYRTEVDRIQDEFGEMNYYPLSERKIITEYLDMQDKSKFSYEFFYHNGKNILQNEFRPFRKNVRRDYRTNKEIVQYEGVENRNYVPYSLPVSYELKNLRNVTAVGAPGKYKKEGCAVSTGKMRMKKILYIIPQIDESKEPIQIPEKDLEAFRIDYKKRENKLVDRDRANKTGFFNLPANGETRPVFYICLGGRLYFGFTPRLRLFYDHTIREGLKPAHRKGTLDYARAMFGYAEEGSASAEQQDSRPKSYRTKLSFSDAVLVTENSNVLHDKKKAILGEPNPTSCLEYVKPQKDGSPDTYNGNSFELRGVKQYWLHGETVPHEVEQKQMKVASDLHPIKAGVKFRGKVRFRNLTRDELGLLLWSIRLNQGCRMNVGKAKSYGYGQIRLDILEAREMELSRAYGTDTLALEPFRPVEVEDSIRFYKDTVNAFLGTRRVDEMPHIKEFFAMKDASMIPDNADIRYMDLKQYQEQMKFKAPLKPALQVAKKRE